jgi:membrane-associated protein
MEIIDFIKELLDNPLTALSQFMANHGTITYGLLFLIIFVETGLIVMPLLPGDSLLFAVGILAGSTEAATTGKIELSFVIPLLIGAALLGDNVNYFVGKFFSDFIKSKEKILFLKRSHIEQTEAFYEKHGGQTVIMARFVPIVRTVAPFVAGAGSMKYSTYITFCIIGAVLWVTGVTLIGYFLGTNDWVKANFSKVVLGIVAVSVLPMVWGVLKAKLAKK